MIVSQRPSRGANRRNYWKPFSPYLHDDARLTDPGHQRAPARTSTPLPQAEVNDARTRLEGRLVEAVGPTFDAQPAKKYALSSMGQGAPDSGDLIQCLLPGGYMLEELDTEANIDRLIG